ncbi:hypothetical protein WJX81_008428 [Elliptochloris bilobata]|uniref:BZIP domain-containing protein n=1 Tax=Elliptochloris bilobata TaxID=381761 RepID=A0AAW1SGP9_9CHLO
MTLAFDIEVLLHGPARRTIVVLDETSQHVHDACGPAVRVGQADVHGTIASCCRAIALQYIRLLTALGEASQQVLALLLDELGHADAAALLPFAARLHLGLEAVRVTDIPMHRKAAGGRALFDVLLLCRRLRGTAPALAELVVAGAAGSVTGRGSGSAGPPEGAPGGEPLVLRWVKPPQGFWPAALPCWRASRALPGATESAPTQSLQKHLAAGKPVALTGARTGAGAAPSHLLLQRGGETFLHELCLPDEDPLDEADAAASAAALEAAPGLRLADFSAFADEHARLGSASLQAGAAPAALSEPAALHTWYFPLRRSDTVAWAEAAPSPLAQLLRGIAEAFRALPLPPPLLATGLRQVTAVQTHARRNDAALLPSVPQDTFRRGAYARAAAELRTLADAFGERSPAHRDLAAAATAAATAAAAPLLPLPPPSPHGRLAAAAPTGAGFGVAVGRAGRAADERAGAAAAQPSVNKRRRCEEVERDVNGRPLMPIRLGQALIVYDLGTVEWRRKSFHSETNIWPIGYRSVRFYASRRNPEVRVAYECEILDGGDAPLFRLIAEDDRDHPLTGPTASAPWTAVVRQVAVRRAEIEAARGDPPPGPRAGLPSVSGPEYFGFAAPTIARLIQELPGAERCGAHLNTDFSGGENLARPASMSLASTRERRSVRPPNRTDYEVEDASANARSVPALQRRDAGRSDLACALKESEYTLEKLQCIADDPRAALRTTSATSSRDSEENYLQDGKRKRLYWKDRMDEPAEDELAALPDEQRELVVRRAKNREAARKSRERKVMRIEALQRSVADLQAENELLLQCVQEISVKATAAQSEQRLLREQIAAIRSMAATAEDREVIDKLLEGACERMRAEEERAVHPTRAGSRGRHGPARRQGRAGVAETNLHAHHEVLSSDGEEPAAVAQQQGVGSGRRGSARRYAARPASATSGGELSAEQFAGGGLARGAAMPELAYGQGMDLEGLANAAVYGGLARLVMSVQRPKRGLA